MAVWSALVAVIVTPLGIVADEFVIDFSAWLPELPAEISDGLIPFALVVTATLLFYMVIKTKFSSNNNEALQSVFVLLRRIYRFDDYRYLVSRTGYGPDVAVERSSRGQRSQRSEVKAEEKSDNQNRGQKTEVRSQESSEVRSQRQEIRSQRSESQYSETTNQQNRKEGFKKWKEKGAHFSRFNRMHMQNLFLILTPDSRFLLIDQEKNFNVKEYRKNTRN